MMSAERHSYRAVVFKYSFCWTRLHSLLYKFAFHSGPDYVVTTQCAPNFPFTSTTDASLLSCCFTRWRLQHRDGGVSLTS